MAKQIKKIATRQDDMRLISGTSRRGGWRGDVGLGEISETTTSSRVMV